MWLIGLLDYHCSKADVSVSEMNCCFFAQHGNYSCQQSLSSSDFFFFFFNGDLKKIEQVRTLPEVLEN